MRVITAVVNLEPKQLCALVLALLLLIVGAFDLYAQIRLPAGSTLSEYLRELSGRYPLIPFLVGLLCGHLFWTGK